MEDKILIKSELNKKVKNFLKYAPIVLLGIALICVALLSKRYEYHSYYSSNRLITKFKPGWDLIFIEPIPTFAVILGGLSLILAPIIFIIYLVNRKCELCITENNVKGKTIFGKEVVLPLYMVSAYSTRKFLSTIAVATSSGITKFALIKNYAEIGEVLSQKINERQQNTAYQTATSTQSAQPSSMDELKKLKELLDMGIITQEEFDAKKKQLLGL